MAFSPLSSTSAAPGERYVIVDGAWLSGTPHRVTVDQTLGDQLVSSKAFSFGLASKVRIPIDPQGRVAFAIFDPCGTLIGRVSIENAERFYSSGFKAVMAIPPQ